MANILYDPWLNPMRFYVPNLSTGYHSRFMEDYEFYDTIVPWEQHFDYYQPWESSDLIKLQLQADFGPHTVNILDMNGDVWQSVQYNQYLPNAQNPNLHLYLLDLDLSALPQGTYRLQRVSGIDNPLITITNRIQICANHKYTLLLDYQDELYHEGTFFQDSSGTNIYYPSFRVEGAVKYKNPASKGAPDFEDQPLDLQTVKAIPYNVYELIIGDRCGVPPYVIDIVNRITTCSSVKYDGRQFVKPINNQFDKNEIDGYPAHGWRAEVRPASNRPSRVYQNNAPQSGRIGVVITVGSKGFGTDTGGTTYEIPDVQ